MADIFKLSNNNFIDHFPINKRQYKCHYVILKRPWKKKLHEQNGSQMRKCEFPDLRSQDMFSSVNDGESIPEDKEKGLNTPLYYLSIFR